MNKDELTENINCELDPIVRKKLFELFSKESKESDYKEWIETNLMQCFNEMQKIIRFSELLEEKINKIEKRLDVMSVKLNDLDATTFFRNQEF